MNDFSNVLWAYGGDWFDHGHRVGALGVEDPGRVTLDTPEAHRAAEFYDRLLGIASREQGLGLDGRGGGLPGRPDGDGAAVARGRRGRGGLRPQGQDRVRRAAPRPQALGEHVRRQGPASTPPRRSASSAPPGCSSSWATSRRTQLANLKSKAGGGTPTRQSVYDLPEVVKARKAPSPMPNILTYDAVSQAWKPENIGLRPKIRPGTSVTQRSSRTSPRCSRDRSRPRRRCTSARRACSRRSPTPSRSRRRDA